MMMNLSFQSHSRILNNLWDVTKVENRRNTIAQSTKQDEEDLDELKLAQLKSELLSAKKSVRNRKKCNRRDSI